MLNSDNTEHVAISLKKIHNFCHQFIKKYINLGDKVTNNDQYLSQSLSSSSSSLFNSSKGILMSDESSIAQDETSSSTIDQFISPIPTATATSTMDNLISHLTSSFSPEIHKDSFLSSSSSNILIPNLTDVAKICQDTIMSETTTIIPSDDEPKSFTYLSEDTIFLILSVNSLILIISLIGNIFVAYHSLHKKKSNKYNNSRQSVEIFFCNLAISDLIITILHAPLNSIRLIANDWPLGPFFCRLLPYIQTTVVYVSTFSMTFIAIERYKTLAFPLKPKLEYPQLIIAFIWFISAIFSIPFAIYINVFIKLGFAGKESHLVCDFNYPDENGDQRAGNIRKLVDVITFILQFVIPWCLMVILYSLIVIEMWSKETIGNSAKQQQEKKNIRTKKTTILMLLIVTGIFSFCWLPFNIHQFLFDFGTLNYGADNFYTSTITHWIAISSVCYNPVIYCLMDKDALKDFKLLIKRLFNHIFSFCSRRNRHHGHGQIYHNCNNHDPCEGPNVMISMSNFHYDSKKQTYTPLRAISGNQGNSTSKFTTELNDRSVTANSGALVLSKLITESVSDYNSHSFNSNRSTCSGSKSKSVEPGVFHCNCHGSNSPLINNTLSTGSCPITITTNVPSSKSRDDLSSGSGCNGGGGCYGRGKSCSYFNFNGNDTGSNTSSACGGGSGVGGGSGGCSNDHFSAELSRKRLLTSKHLTGCKNRTDIHKNHRHCHRSQVKKITKVYCDTSSPIVAIEQRDQTLSSL